MSSIKGFNMYYLLLLLIPICAVANTTSTIPIKLSSDIDKSVFYEESIKEFYFSEEKPITKYIKSKDTFESIETKLIITTDLPLESNSFPYKIGLISKESVCFSKNKDDSYVMGDDFVMLDIDGYLLTANYPYLSKEFNSSSHGNHQSIHDFKLKFSPIYSSEFPKLIESCSGKIVVNIGVDI